MVVSTQDLGILMNRYTISHLFFFTATIACAFVFFRQVGFSRGYYLPNYANDVRRFLLASCFSIALLTSCTDRYCRFIVPTSSTVRWINAWLAIYFLILGTSRLLLDFNVPVFLTFMALIVPVLVMVFGCIYKGKITISGSMQLLLFAFLMIDYAAFQTLSFDPHINDLVGAVHWNVRWVYLPVLAVCLGMVAKKWIGNDMKSSEHWDAKPSAMCFWVSISTELAYEYIANRMYG
jgi:hypothetical protein